jgi:hypothetical protein
MHCHRATKPKTFTDARQREAEQGYRTPTSYGDLIARAACWPRSFAPHLWSATWPLSAAPKVVRVFAVRLLALRFERDGLNCRVRIFTFILALAAAVAALCIHIRASHAYQTGDSHWCHVTDRGDVISWDCDYDSNDECQPAIVTGGGGYCAINPYWHPNPPQSESTSTDTTPAQAAVPIPRPKPH